MYDSQRGRNPAVFSKPYDTDHRCIRRRKSRSPWFVTERRNNGERRLDADWRFAVIRRCRKE